MKDVHVHARCRAEITTLVYANTKSNKADFMTKCHTYELHMKGYTTLGLKTQTTENSIETAPSGVNFGQKCPDLKERRRITHISVASFTCRVTSRLVPMFYCLGICLVVILCLIHFHPGVLLFDLQQTHTWSRPDECVHSE